MESKKAPGRKDKDIQPVPIEKGCPAHIDPPGNLELVYCGTAESTFLFSRFTMIVQNNLTASEFIPADTGFFSKLTKSGTKSSLD